MDMWQNDASRVDHIARVLIPLLTGIAFEPGGLDATTVGFPSQSTSESKSERTALKI